MLGTLADLHARVGGRLVGNGDVPIARISAIDEATPDALTFATDEKYFAAALASKAGAVLVDASVPFDDASATKPLLVIENARAALASFLATLKTPRPRGPFLHPSAVVEDGAVVGERVYIGAHAYVGAHAKIGDGCTISPQAYVGNDASIGEETWLHPQAIVHERCVVGARNVLHSGCVIGSEGFGWAFIEGRLERIPQVGNVVLGDDVEIGANTCVDRAQTGSTTIGEGTKIDNLVQIGHNCRIGKHCAIASLTGFAGSTSVGDYVKVGGQVGTRGHMHIGSRATIAGRGGVFGDVPEGAMVSGYPARDHREALRTEAYIRKIPDLLKRLAALERKVD
jgi:UDP-3-O-[3-hydroxymyristoyl] glucosamine N-acyltransferase